MFTMTEVQGMRKAVMVPTDARGWELYSDMEGVEKAAQEIYRVVTEAVTSSTPYRAAVKVNAVLTKFERFGATDTEPRGHANHILSEAFGVPNALYISHPIAAAIPGLKQLKAELERQEKERDRLTAHEEQLDAQDRDRVRELNGYLSGLRFAINTLEGA